MAATTINPNLVYSFFISKQTIDNSLMSIFKGMLYTDTYNKYKQIHDVDISIKNLSENSKYKAVNPLEQKGTEVKIDEYNMGVILALPATFLLNPIKLDLTNILNLDTSPNINDTNTKLTDIFKNILGYSYISFDITRNILCLYDLFINPNLCNIPAPVNTSPYLDTVIQTNFLAIKNDQLSYGLQEKLNISVATHYTNSDISYNIAGKEDQYKLWGKIIMESIINTLVIFPYSCTIWVNVDINNVKIDNWFDIMMHILLYTGFSNPYFSTKDPLNKDYNYKFVGLTKKNDIKYVSQKDISDEYNNVLYLFNQNIIKCSDSDNKLGNCNCNMKIFFDKKTIIWLLRLPFNTITINIKPDGTKDMSQKEFAGAFKIKNIKCEKDIKINTMTEYRYIDTKGTENIGYIASVDKITNKIKIMAKNKYLFYDASNIKDEHFDYIDFKDLFESCSYTLDNFVCELELDGRSITYSGERIKTFDKLINNIEQTYKNSSTVPMQTIKDTLRIISNNLNTLEIDTKFYDEQIQKAKNDAEIEKIKENKEREIKNLSDKIKKEANKIKKEANKVEKAIKTVIDKSEKDISDIIKKLVDGNISDLGNILSGKENSVKSPEGFVQFHTHPYQEYLKNGWTICFPSGPDFSSFLGYFIFHNSIASAVITVEGLYIISMNQYMCSEINLKNFNKALNNTNLGSRILHYFEFEKSDFKTPKDFCDHINNLKYDDKLWCVKINEIINKITTPHFYINEIVKYSTSKMSAQIINKKVVDGKNIYVIKNVVTKNIVHNVAENAIHKDVDNNKLIFDKLKEYNLGTIQNPETDLIFLNLPTASPLFKCEFKTWAELLEYDNNKFDITYSQIGKQCINDHETIDIIKKIYNYAGVVDFYNFNTDIATDSAKLPKIFNPRTTVFGSEDYLDISLEKVSTPKSRSVEKGDSFFTPDRAEISPVRKVDFFTGDSVEISPVEKGDSFSIPGRSEMSPVGKGLGRKLFNDTFSG